MFWDIENIPKHGTALIDDGTGKNYSYGDLLKESEKLAALIRLKRKSLVFLFCDNSAVSVISYITALRCGHAVYPANYKMNYELKEKLIQLYRPEIILSINKHAGLSDGYEHEETDSGLSVYLKHSCGSELNKDLALLLSTSGTTGSPKLVRLSYKNIQSNAESIAEYLTIDADERAVTSLPMSYSYGLSVINSHLLKGASLFCTEKSMVMRNFWESFNEYKCTSFAGVPYNYQMLKRLRFDKMDVPYLKTMTQAGGRLSEEFIKFFYDISKEKNIRFFVMYGQTEASPRISFVPYGRLKDKIGSIGIPVPGGSIKIYSDGKSIDIPGKAGELVYSGSNVMMGYAESREDLVKGDEYKGTLSTGDLAYKDSDGFVYITGRLKRFVKLFGLRVNLDEVEKMIENSFKVASACCGGDDELKIFIQTPDENLSKKVKEKVTETYKIHNSVVRVKNIITIPVTASGKRDYNKIKEIGI